MTQEQFRLWIIILVALFLLTIWFKLGMKMYKYGVCGDKWEKHQMMMKK